jgi:hypothetical protein
MNMATAQRILQSTCTMLDKRNEAEFLSVSFEWPAGCSMIEYKFKDGSSLVFELDESLKPVDVVSF